MQPKKKKKSDGLIKSVVLAHVVLGLHLCLLAVLGILVAFLGGVMQYMTWILVGGMAVVALSAYLFFRHLRRQSRSIGEVLQSPAFAGRSVEINLLGGVVTLRLAQPEAKPTLPAHAGQQAPQLEDSKTASIRAITDLGKLLQAELITPEEFDKAKERLLDAK